MPGPIVSVKQKLDALPNGAALKILASDQGFLRDLPSFCESTGHSLLAIAETGRHRGLRMAMNIMGFKGIAHGVETAGVANFAALAERSGTTLFI